MFLLWPFFWEDQWQDIHKGRPILGWSENGSKNWTKKVGQIRSEKEDIFQKFMGPSIKDVVNLESTEGVKICQWIIERIADTGDFF